MKPRCNQCLVSGQASDESCSWQRVSGWDLFVIWWVTQLFILFQDLSYRVWAMSIIFGTCLRTIDVTCMRQFFRSSFFAICRCFAKSSSRIAGFLFIWSIETVLKDLSSRNQTVHDLTTDFLHITFFQMIYCYLETFISDTWNKL